jgi:hypothetical protein
MNEKIGILLIVLSVFSLYIKYLEMMNVEEEENYIFSIGNLNVKFSRDNINGTFKKNILYLFFLNYLLLKLCNFDNISFKLGFILVYDIFTLLQIYFYLNQNYFSSLFLIFHFLYISIYDFIDFLKLFIKGGTIQCLYLKNLFSDIYINEEARITFKFILNFLILIILIFDTFDFKLLKIYLSRYKSDYSEINNNFYRNEGKTKLKWK